MNHLQVFLKNLLLLQTQILSSGGSRVADQAHGGQEEETAPTVLHGSSVSAAADAAAEPQHRAIVSFLKRIPHLLLWLAVSCGPVSEPPALAASATENEAGEDSLYKYLAVYTDVLALVDRAYVEEVDSQTLIAASLEGATDALDPFSLYIPAAEVDAYRAALSVAQDRSGLVVLKERGVAYVVAVEDGSPAADAGVQSGVIIEKLQAQRTRQMPVWRIRQLLGQPPGTRLELDLVAPNGGKRSARFNLVSLEPPRARMSMIREVPILRIPGFSARTPSDIDELLDYEEDKLVIDLRGVAGGEPAAAYAVAERFVSGELGILAGRHGALQRFENPVPPIWNGKLVVLVDRGTQGPAEVLATVLRQSAGASLVGDQTFGHAGKIESVGLSSGALLEVTGAFYTGPDLEPLAHSLEPDLRVRPEFPSAADDDEGQPERPERDKALERAVDLMLER